MLQISSARYIAGLAVRYRPGPVCYLLMPDNTRGWKEGTRGPFLGSEFWKDKAHLSLSCGLRRPEPTVLAEAL